MFNSITTKTVSRLYSSEYNLSEEEFESKLLATASNIKSHLSKVEGMASEIFRIGYARCFRASTRAEQKEAIASFRDRIEELLGKRFSRAFGHTASSLDFTLPTQSELETINWFAHEGAQTKKTPKFGVDELLKFFSRREKTIQRFERKTPEMEEELRMVAVCVAAIKGVKAK